MHSNQIWHDNPTLGGEGFYGTDCLPQSVWQASEGNENLYERLTPSDRVTKFSPVPVDKVVL